MEDEVRQPEYKKARRRGRFLPFLLLPAAAFMPFEATTLEMQSPEPIVRAAQAYCAEPERSPYRFEIKPFVKIGTIDSTEKGHKEATGHKFMLGAGIGLEGGEKASWKAGTELWTMAEPEDNDPDMPHNGISTHADIGYRFSLSDFLLRPFIGASAERWERNSSSGTKFYGNLMFANTVGGLDINYKSIHGKAGVFMPIWVKANQGKNPEGEMGFFGSAGTSFKGVDVDLFYKNANFSRPDSKTEFYGVMAGFRF